jgi:hypothetical protein
VHRGNPVYLDKVQRGMGELHVQHHYHLFPKSHPLTTTMGNGGSFPGGKADCDVKLTTHLHLVPRSGMLEL